MSSETARKAWYGAGQRAALDGFPHHMNPYQQPEARQFWSSGWANPRLSYEAYRK